MRRNEKATLGRLDALRASLGRARPIGTAVGLVLLVAAIIVVARQAGTFAEARSAMASASPLSIVALLASVLASVVLTGVTFHCLTRRYGRVGFLEMQALMSSTALVNYLPLRPGLIGRVVYHKQRNDIRAGDSLCTIVEAMLLSVVALALLVPLLLSANWLRGAAGVDAGWIPWSAASLPLVAVAPLAARERTRFVAFAFLARYTETLLTTLRYAIAFHLIGVDITWHAGAAIACVSMIATMVPFVSNGLGLREWAIGLLAPLLVDVPLERGLVAELVNRAAEVAVILPCGLVGAWWLWRGARATA